MLVDITSNKFQKFGSLPIGTRFRRVVHSIAGNNLRAEAFFFLVKTHPDEAKAFNNDGSKIKNLNGTDMTLYIADYTEVWCIDSPAIKEDIIIKECD